MKDGLKQDLAVGDICLFASNDIKICKVIELLYHGEGENHWSDKVKILSFNPSDNTWSKKSGDTYPSRLCKIDEKTRQHILTTLIKEKLSK